VTACRRTVLVVAAIVAASAGTALAGTDRGDGSPIVVAGQRVVELRNTGGGLSVYTQIPQTSLFRRHGGVGVPCTFTASGPGTTSDGQTYLEGDVVQSQRWIFEEGTWARWRSLPPTPGEPIGLGPLATALRWFRVYCDVKASATFLVYRSVPVSDPLIDPHTQLNELYSRLQLIRPVVHRNPIVDQWGGLVVRYPVWLGIDPAAWATQITRPPIDWRGWVIDLVAEPSELEFQVDFTPNPDKPSAPFRGIVPCVAAGESPVADDVALPAMPELPEQAEPGVNGPCTWTPPGPGTATIQARITFDVTMRANGFTEDRPDYVWTSEPVTYTVGELTSVNLDPTAD